jgi:hypothetical protein
MKFRAGELAFTASVADVSTTTSAQTGNALRALTIQFRAPKQAMHELALDAVRERARGGLFSLTDAGDVEAEWRVEDSSVAYVGTEPWGMHHHTWRVEQIERLAITRLKLNDLDLEPYDYKEELTDGVLRLAARCPISNEDLEKLATFAEVDVVRQGISDTPRRMWLEGYVHGPGAKGSGVALVCSDVVEPRVTMAGFSGAHEPPKAGQVRDLDAWAL